MKVSLNWLKQYVDIDIPVDELCHKLTMAGVEVGEAKYIGDWGECYVGLITAVAKHPNADRLSLCTVETGEETVNVVCGAPNVHPGIKICLAKPGSNLYNPRNNKYEILKPSKIRGVDSEGMICSELELGLGNDHDGILILPDELEVGIPIERILSDVVLDVEITPNRLDCYSVLGIAQEIAAITGKTIQMPELYEPELEPETSIPSIKIDIQSPELCPRYSGIVIRNVKIAPSPAWLKDRLKKSGLNPINNIVDITNYVMHEFNQPMHAFDLKTLAGSAITIRTATDDEELTLLDGQKIKLNTSALVIADGQKTIALAGIMGGSDTQINDTTTDIFLESASFNGFNNRQSSDLYRVKTDASVRFEKNLNPLLTLKALKRAIYLILNIIENSTPGEIIDIDLEPERKPIKINLSIKKLVSILGMQIDIQTASEVLQKLGFQCVNTTIDEIECEVPYWRNDISIQEDLVEEIIRIIGYDEVPTRMLSTSIPHHEPSTAHVSKESIRDLLVSAGMQEIISYPLTNESELIKTGIRHELPNPIPVLNPMSGNFTHLRTTIRHNLLRVLEQNQYYNDGPFKFFELGRVFHKGTAGLPDEIETITGVCAGLNSPIYWNCSPFESDFYSIKGILDSMFQQLDIEATYELEGDSTFNPSESAKILVNKLPVGNIGSIKPTVLSEFNIRIRPTFMFDIDLNKIIALNPETIKPFAEISKFPEATRDLSFIVDLNITADSISTSIANSKNVQNIDIFDVYSGEELPAGKKSIGFRIHLQSMDKTLSNKEINKEINGIIKLSENSFGAILRDS
ncbi:MAG TPA: phenylalanine--tRNA ligase subunit beta [Dehalococcoidia bacterium]|jgi:phenylalanyl-tRNA synthetase beta chain|nr:phenylalanine--tRNA ligase subunit beta [Dehalococcoidia bacterium]